MNFKPHSHSFRQAARKLNVKFVITSMPVGGAETLLVNLIRHMDKSAFSPEVVCLKEPGELGNELAAEIPVYANMLLSKWDVSILPRLAYLFHRSRTDAVITVGAGDKMFWGRLAAKLAGVPVICSALHSTGWPDGVGRLNRLITPLTDGFIAVAQKHAEHLVHYEGLPAERVYTIPNGVDINRFRPNHVERVWLRAELGIAEDSQVVGIVAALRPEKNHGQFIKAAREVLRHHPNTHFVIVGEGPERATIEESLSEYRYRAHFHLLGNRSDTERILAGLDLFCLTSRNEANPVSILEALACCVPVASTNVGSISETVIDGKTGILTQPLKWEETAAAMLGVLHDTRLAARMGRAGRVLVRDNWSLQAMVQGYEMLIESIFNDKAQLKGRNAWQRPARSVSDASVHSASVNDRVVQGVSKQADTGGTRFGLPLSESADYHAPQALTS
ncbi:MAG: glycosyltransferase [Planctomycetales bacterium]|nr:glycosyltransferase [Planctomycetales bacterium]